MNATAAGSLALKTTASQPASRTAKIAGVGSSPSATEVSTCGALLPVSSSQRLMTSRYGSVSPAELRMTGQTFSRPRVSDAKYSRLAYPGTVPLLTGAMFLAVKQAGSTPMPAIETTSCFS